MRPVLVIQSDVYNAKMNNVVVAQITSVLKYASDPVSFTIDVANAEGRQSGLLRTSIVSCINLSTVHTKRIK